MGLKLPIGDMVLMLIGGIGMFVGVVRRQSRPGEWIIPLWCCLKKLKGLVIGSCLAEVIVFHALPLGQAHTHFHWLAGGLTNGWRQLSLSKVDWGQSTYRMADWARAHPEKRPLTVMFVSGRGNPSLLVKDLEIDTSPKWQTPDIDGQSMVPKSGWYLLSSNQLTQKSNLYFRNTQPVSWPYADVALFFVPDHESNRE